MPTYDESARNYAFLLSEGPGTLSRERVTMLQDAAKSQPCVAGTVLGQITSGGKYTPYDDTVAGLVAAGATVAAGILAENVDADLLAAGDVTVQIIKRIAEVKDAELSWHSAVDAGAKAAAKTALAGTNMIAIRS